MLCFQGMYIHDDLNLRPLVSNNNIGNGLIMRPLITNQLRHLNPQGGIHLARNKIARVAMFLHHAKSPLPVVQEKPLPVVKEKLKTFNVVKHLGHPFH